MDKTEFKSIDFMLAIFALFLGTALSTLQFANSGVMHRIFWAYSESQVYGRGGVGNMMQGFFYTALGLAVIIAIYLIGKAIIVYWQKIPITSVAKLTKKKHFKLYVYLAIIFIPVLTNQGFDIHQHFWGTPNTNMVQIAPTETTDQKIDDLQKSINNLNLPTHQDIVNLTNAIDQLISQMQNNSTTNNK